MTNNEDLEKKRKQRMEAQKRGQRRMKRKRLKGFECKDCNHAIFQSSKLFKDHSLSVHKNKRPFECLECDKNYVDIGGLDVHIRKIHDNEINHFCSKCWRPFFEKSEYLNHSKICTASYYLIECNICNNLEVMFMATFKCLKIYHIIYSDSI